jgi:hypothetical protein
VARGAVLDPHPDLRRPGRRRSSAALPRLHDHPAGTDLPAGPVLGRRRDGRRRVRPPAAGPAVRARAAHRRRRGSRLDGRLPPSSERGGGTYVPGIPGASAWGEGEGKEARRGTGFLPVSYIGMRTRFGLTGVKDGSAAPENLTAANFLEMEDSSRRAQAGLHGPY